MSELRCPCCKDQGIQKSQFKSLGDDSVAYFGVECHHCGTIITSKKTPISQYNIWSSAYRDEIMAQLQPTLRIENKIQPVDVMGKLDATTTGFSDPALYIDDEEVPIGCDRYWAVLKEYYFGDE